MKLPFERPFESKYAGRSPERISCLYSIRLVLITPFVGASRKFWLRVTVFALFGTVIFIGIQSLNHLVIRGPFIANH